MKRYSHILFCTAIILAVVGCKKSTLEPSPTQSDQLIRFTTSVEATKATETDLTALQTYGQFNIATFLTDDVNTHYYTDIVKYSNSQWSSDVNRYWPVSYDLNMFAYSPLEDFVDINSSEIYADYSLTYTTPADIYGQVDLLVKTLTNESPSDDLTAVNLKFDHALSSIKFKVQFEDESNITLSTITIKYINIEKERTYNFASEAWGASESIYFDTTDGLTTSIGVDETKTTTDPTESSIVFDGITEQLMIIPQPVDLSSQSAPHYISIQIAYTLNSSDGSTLVETGVMPLPAPNTVSAYLQGEVYTYNIIVNGELITFSDITIEDQNNPVYAYGNIDLALITAPMTAAEIGYTGTTETDAQLYYTTAQRVKDLLDDGVRDFVVVGSMGANNEDSENTLGNGKLGCYGSTSSPFYIGAQLASLGSGSEDLFSIDLRGTFDYPRFADANNDTSDSDEVAVVSDNTIDDDEPILIAGLFANLDWLDEVILPHGIAAIGNHAFESCGALRSIDIADVEHIEIGAFQDCDALVTVENGALTRVHEHGFDNCTSLTTIDLSNVLEIDDFGFVDCSSLTNVNLSNLDDIGQHAFNGCFNLTLVEGTDIPDFTMVEDYAFSKCYRLGENGAKINLALATKVGDHALAECEHIQLSSGYLNELTEVGTYGLYKCTLLGSGQEFSIPNLASVGMAGFADCPEVNIVEGLENLEIISYYAFQNCTSLTGYSTGATNKILSLPKVTTVEGYGLSNTAITNVSFSNKLGSIGEFAFNECRALTTISGLESVTSVGAYAFSDCSVLEELNLPEVVDFGTCFISGCNAIKTLKMEALISQTATYSDGDDYENIFSSIENLTTLETLILPSVEAELTAQYEVYDEEGNVEYFNDWNFIISNTNLEYVDLASVGGSIGGWQHFSDNVNLKYLDLSSITEVSSMTFQENDVVVSIDLRSATTIGQMTFQKCTSLEKLNLSSLVDYEDGEAWSFSDIPDGQCEIWISDAQAANITGTTTWQGVTWKAIHKASDNVEFTLID